MNEKEFYAKVVIDWGISISAKDKNEAIEKIKALYLQNHDIELSDEEIKEIEEDKPSKDLQKAEIQKLLIKSRGYLLEIIGKLSKYEDISEADLQTIMNVIFLIDDLLVLEYE